MRRAKWLFEIWLKHSIISDCGVGLRHVYKMSHPLVVWLLNLIPMSTAVALLNHTSIQL